MAALPPPFLPLSPRVRAVVAWTLVVTPFLLLLTYVAVYAVNGPEWDHVAAAEIFYRWRDGRFDLEYLFRLHNEHRKVVQRLVLLGLGLLTRWDNRPEAFLHWGLMCATAALLFAAFRRDVAPRDSRLSALLLFVPAACLLASPRSYEALLGEGLLHYGSVLPTIGALYLLGYRTGPAALAGAALCGLMASFSIGSGLLIWPIGALVLLSRMRTDGLRAVPAIVWGAIGAATLTLYFRGYVDPGNSSGPGYLVQEPAKALAHFLATNGSSLAPHIPSAVAVGAVIVALDAWCLLRVFDDWRRRRERPPLGAWLIITVLISIVMITLNRAGFGVRQGIESRYTVLSVLAPIGIYWCTLARGRQWNVHASVRVFVTVLLLSGYVYASGHAWRMAPAWNARKTWMAYLFYTAKYQPLSLLEKLYPNPHHARIYSAEMEQMGYNVFAEPHIDPRQLIPGAPKPEFEIELVNSLPVSRSKTITVTESDAIEIVGWAYNQAGTGPARAVFLTVDGTTDYPAHVGRYRVERGGYLRGRARRWSGFEGSIGGFVLSPGEHTLSLKIVPDQGYQAFVTEPFLRIVRR